MADRTLSRLCATLLSAALAAQTPEPAAVPPPTGRVEGRVLGPLGEPMRAVEVWAASSEDLEHVVGRSRTDGEGCYVLPKLPLERLCVFARADGLTTAWGSADLSVDAMECSARLRLWPATTIRGRVVDADGAPVADAQVLGTRDRTSFECAFRSPETTTDADGRFELRGVPIGDQVLRVWKDGYVQAEPTCFAVADREAEVVLARGPGVRMRIRVDDIPSELAKHVEVSFEADWAEAFPLPARLRHEQHLDAEGRWAMDDLPRRSWVLRLRSPDVALNPRAWLLRRRDPLEDLAFTAVRLTATPLHGTVRRRDGSPLGGQVLVCGTLRTELHVDARSQSCTTDAEGHFRLEVPLAKGEPFSLQLRGSRFVLQQPTATETSRVRELCNLNRYEDTVDVDRPLQLVAVPAAHVRGRITEADGTAVPFRRCSLQGMRGETWYELIGATSRRDGSVEFPGVHVLDDWVRIEVQLQVGAAASEAFRLSEGTVSRPAFALPRAGSLGGRVLDAKGDPVPGAQVVLEAVHVASGRWFGSVMADREGRYAFVGVAPVGHTLSVHHGDARLFTAQKLVVDEGKPTEFDVHLPKHAGRR